MYRVSYQNDLDAETCDYAIDIIRVLLFKSKWKNKDNRLSLKYYIDDTTDGKILVILTNPIKIYPLRINEKNNKIKYNIDYAIKDVLIKLGINVKYNIDEDVNTLSVDVKGFEVAKYNYYGILQSVNHIQADDNRVSIILDEIMSTFMDKSKWDCSRQLAYLCYDMKYDDGALMLFINKKIVKKIEMNIDEYQKTISMLDNELLKYNIMRYGNVVGDKYLSTNDIYGSFKKYCGYEMKLKANSF